MQSKQPREQRRHWVGQALERHEAPLLRFASSIVGPSHAPDVVQDTFMKLCKQEPATLEGRLAGWLFTVCRNRAIEVRRAQQKLRALDEQDVDASPPDSGPIPKLERRESLSRVGAAIAALPERHRQVVLLKVDAGLSYKQIAEVLELSTGNVGFILHQAIKTIRRALAGEELAVASAIGSTR